MTTGREDNRRAASEARNKSIKESIARGRAVEESMG
jgi:hypothetical protein